ncbi:hypothetical protein [Caballeronia sp. dw_276]|uniref:hypothetical protein n=1 Tax=Caballeronia sp. dw_276 TaxID=2719795 RepID=UPI001BD511A0|nr:hypothetical protein [Caballeronia sp. dw_276]
MHDIPENTEFALRREIERLKDALDQAVRAAEEREAERIAQETSNRELAWAHEIDRRRHDVQSARAEVKLAEQLAIANHMNAEKDRAIARLSQEVGQANRELAEARAAYEVVMNSYSMAITRPMRALVKALRRIRH